jgi:hypothetical protein
MNKPGYTLPGPKVGVILLPRISIMMNSWFVMTAAIIGQVFMILFVKSEYEEKERFPGEELRKYRPETYGFLPVQYRKGTESINAHLFSRFKY